MRSNDSRRCVWCGGRTCRCGVRTASVRELERHAGADLDVRTTVCARCGSGGRLVVTHGESVVSRCYACGDESRRPLRVTVAGARPAARTA